MFEEAIKVFPYTYNPLKFSKKTIKQTIDGHTFYHTQIDPEPGELYELSKCIYLIQEIVEQCEKTALQVLGEINEENQATFAKLHFNSMVYSLTSLERQTWNSLPDNMEMERFSIENFHDKAYNWILTKCGRDSAASVLQQLCTWKKPRDVTVRHNYYYMNKVNNTIPFMSSTIEQLDPRELKQCFFAAPPKPWKDAFVEIYGYLEDEKTAERIY